MARLAFLLALLAASAAGAQVPAEFRHRSPAELARDAFAGTYGRMLVAEAGRILRDSADPACARERGLDRVDFEARARALFVGNGTRMYEFIEGLVDTQKFDAAFVKRAGPEGKRDYARLRDTPAVAGFRALADRIHLATVADQVVENVDRHALLARLRLARRLSPLATGDAALLAAGERETSLEPVDAFLKAHRTPDFERWMALQDAVAEAGKESLRMDELLRAGPVQLTPDAARDLAALCILTR